MELHDVTDEKIIPAMRQAVLLRGRDWVYPRGEYGWTMAGGGAQDGCRYVRSDVDEPACIVGVAAHKAGVSLNALRAREGDGGWSLFQNCSTRVREAIGEAQRFQDEGWNWGDAIDEFDRMLDRG